MGWGLTMMMAGAVIALIGATAGGYTEAAQGIPNPVMVVGGIALAIFGLVRTITVFNREDAEEQKEREQRAVWREEARREQERKDAAKNKIADRPIGLEWERLRMEVLSRDNHTCQRCRKLTTWGMHVDHVVPLSRGGHPTSRTNLQALCENCNMDKGTNIVSWTSYAPGQYHDGRVL